MFQNCTVSACLSVSGGIFRVHGGLQLFLRISEFHFDVLAVGMNVLVV